MAKEVTFLTLYIILIISSSIQSTCTEDIDDNDPTTWPGHLEPLGSKNIKHQVTTVDEFPEPQDFFRDFVVPGQPLLIKNGAKISPAYKLWTDEYFLSLPGAENTTVAVEQRKKENRTFPVTEITFKEFVGKYNDSDIYMVNGVPNILQPDVSLPPPLLCEDLRPHLSDTVMWFSSGGTKSVFHHDDVDNINCLYRGSKRLLFVDYSKYKTKLRLDNAWGGFSDVDIDKVDFTKYPIFYKVEFHEAIMESGDCLFIPYKWYHQVSSVGSNIAVNIWWRHLPSFIPRECDKIPLGTTLDKFNFSSLGSNIHEYAEHDNLLNMFAKVLKKEKHISYDDFIDFLKKAIHTNVTPEFDADIMEFMAHVFQSTDVNKDGSITMDDISQLDEKQFGELENDLAELEGVLGEYDNPLYQMEHNEQQNDEDEHIDEEQHNEL